MSECKYCDQDGNCTGKCDEVDDKKKKNKKKKKKKKNKGKK